MTTPRWTTALGVLDGRVYAVGGEASADDSTDLASVEAYNVTSDSWTRVANMSIPRIGLGVATIGHKLYVAFGWNLAAGDGAVSLLEAYDPTTNAWTTLSSLHYARDHGAMGSIGGRLFVVGGCNAWDAATATLCINETTMASVEMYTPSLDRWTLRQPMPTPRWSMQVAVVDGKLYAIGGEAANGTRLSTVEVYDPEADRWSAQAPMPDARAYFGVGVAGSGSSARIFAVGGCSQECAKPYDTVLQYSVAHNQWTRLASTLPLPRFEFGATTLDGVLYVGGGLHNTNASEAMDSVVSLDLTAPSKTV